MRVSVFLASAALLVEAAYPQAPIDAGNWGNVTVPVHGKYEHGAYAGAELFAGPNKFGSYYAGVLPSGRTVNPAGFLVQVGVNPIAAALTPDTRFFVVVNASEIAATGNGTNTGGYSLSVIDNNSLRVITTYSGGGSFFSGIQRAGFGPYTIFVSGGGDSSVKVFDLGTDGTITPDATASIAIPPMLSAASGYVSHYVTAAAGYFPNFAPQFNPTAGAQLTFPAGMATGPDGRFLYVACSADNSIAVIDAYRKVLVAQVPAGYSPWNVAINTDGTRVFATNRGLLEYRFANPVYDASNGNLTAVAPVAGNLPASFDVPLTNGSVTAFLAPGGNGTNLSVSTTFAAGPAPDELQTVGGAHPAAIASVKSRFGGTEVLFYSKANTDRLGMIRLDTNTVLPDFDLSLISLTLSDGHQVHGGSPTASAVSADTARLYVAESGINSVAVLDITRILSPKLLGRIPTGWYPSSLTLTSDGRFLFITNAKGVGEDLNTKINTSGGNQPPSGVISDAGSDSRTIFGTVQLVDTLNFPFDNSAIAAHNYKVAATAQDATVVPVGGAGSTQIKRVFVIVQESQTFDSVFGTMNNPFGAYASQIFQTTLGQPYFNAQATGAAPFMQQLARTFATAVNFYSDAEESNAGAQFLTSGAATDFTQRTLAVKTGRGLLTNMNADPEDYPDGGYLFQNAARNAVTFKNYGLLTALAGSDNGGSSPASLDDGGLGQSYFLTTPGMAVLGGKNPRGEPRLDLNYPGFNPHIPDSRRAAEFIGDFDRMVAAGTLPQLIYLYLPNRSDAALGQVIAHLMASPAYYDPNSNTGSAIFVTYVAAQGFVDHIHPHRSAMVLVSPFAKPGYIAAQHYSSASVVKTAELLLGLPPNNFGDLMAADLRDLFQVNYNGISFIRAALQSGKQDDAERRK